MVSIEENRVVHHVTHLKICTIGKKRVWLSKRETIYKNLQWTMERSFIRIVFKEH